MKFILLINVIMPTIVGILTFISMINTTAVSNFFFCLYIFNEQLKFRAQLSRAWKKFYNLEAWVFVISTQILCAAWCNSFIQGQLGPRGQANCGWLVPRGQSCPGGKINWDTGPCFNFSFHKVQLQSKNIETETHP